MTDNFTTCDKLRQVKILEEKVKKLQEENEQLKEAGSLKADFISISAHQLRTTLAAMKWILKMFLDKDFGELTTEQQSFMKKAYDSNERMAQIVNEMILTNHSEEVIFKYDWKEGQIVDVIESVLFDFTGESYKRGVEVIFLKPESPLPIIYFDEQKIRVVLQNLIENAIKYSDMGDRTFISAREKNGFIEISVKDTGIGINEEDHKKLFNKFFRAESAKKKESTGSGLGLFTIKKIVQKHGGELWFESKEGRGTTFFFSVPINRNTEEGLNKNLPKS